ncbi:DUF4870 domain-containing protein [Agromyces aerolatus]|uniref:DUF4870 domain-containing protein n=1 Tax=Agromyces sp. LY-1074 TaxID=3074080 RepID=UPI00285B85A2|nr:MULTISPECIES: DUF4870 domain-containing protein [unclassified Agromyces]MDR5700248.1 DUF4870 domain-containing protein [Agromyces sp. LY-1074]MDR5706384.1 DUF4870 domain-containing protein [Agromyces sp. LY-1358]
MSDLPPPPPPPPGPPAGPPPGPPNGPPPSAPPPGGGAYQPQQNPQMSPADEKLWATLVHIGGIFFGFIPALIGYLVLKDRGPFVRAHTATALNFQITMTIAAVVSAILWVVIIGIFISIAIWVLVIVFSIIAAVKANQGQPYTYPLTIKFVS